MIMLFLQEISQSCLLQSILKFDLEKKKRLMKKKNSKKKDEKEKDKKNISAEKKEENYHFIEKKIDI